MSAAISASKEILFIIVHRKNAKQALKKKERIQNLKANYLRFYTKINFFLGYIS